MPKSCLIRDEIPLRVILVQLQEFGYIPAVRAAVDIVEAARAGRRRG